MVEMSTRSIAFALLLGATLIVHTTFVEADARLAPVPEREWTTAQRSIAVRFGVEGRPTNALRTYLHHPRLAENILPFERYIAQESTLSARHRELLILRTAWLCRSQYIWALHAGRARSAGIRSDELTRIARGPDAPGWPPFEAVLLRAVDELLVDSFVSDSTWARLSARFDTPQLMDAVFTVAEMTMVAGTVNSLEVQVDDWLEDRLPVGISTTPAAARTSVRLIGRSPRIAPLEPADWSPEVKAWLARYGDRPVANIYRTYARHLAMDRPRTRVSEHIRQDSTLSPRIREQLIVRIGVLCRSEYEWAAHAPALRRAGMTDAEILAVVDGPAAVRDPVESALLRAVDELKNDAVMSDGTWRDLSVRFDATQMLDILTTVGGYRMVSMALNTFGVQLEPDAERFPSSLR
jgi:alkylhydroperoxidase family enzyme